MPGVDAAPLVGKLHVVRLDEFQSETEQGSDASFEALSYVWGSDFKPHILETSTGSIGLTDSLHGFLTKVRRADASRLLWTDAVSASTRATTSRKHRKCSSCHSSTALSLGPCRSGRVITGRRNGNLDDGSLLAAPSLDGWPEKGIRKGLDTRTDVPLSVLIQGRPPNASRAC